MGVRIMRASSIIAAGLVFMAWASSLEAQAGLKVGYINSASILDKAPGAQEAQDQFNRDVQGYRGQVQQMADEIQAMIEQYDKQQMTLSPEAAQIRLLSRAPGGVRGE